MGSRIPMSLKQNLSISAKISVLSDKVAQFKCNVDDSEMAHGFSLSGKRPGLEQKQRKNFCYQTEIYEKQFSEKNV